MDAWSDNVAFFGCLALLLAGVGLYGSMSYAIAERTHEIGVRMALGATSGRILTLVPIQTASVVILGVVAGAGAALWSAPKVEDLLLGIHARDATALGVAIAVVTSVSFLACYAPMRRATRVDPLKVLNTV